MKFGLAIRCAPDLAPSFFNGYHTLMNTVDGTALHEFDRFVRVRCHQMPAAAHPMPGIVLFSTEHKRCLFLYMCTPVLSRLKASF